MESAHISGATIAKMTRGEDINTNVLIKICDTLKCTSSDIFEIVHQQFGCWLTAKLKRGRIWVKIKRVQKEQSSGFQSKQ
jgi:hypothetical protein